MAEKRLTKDDIQQGLNDIFSAMLQNSRNESEQKYGEVMNQLSRDYGDKLKNMETFHFFIQYEMNEALEYLIQQIYPSLSGTPLDKVSFLYTHYDFFEHQIEGIIRPKEGFACVADKSRWLLNAYLRYIIEGVLPDMTREDNCFWKPHFGKGEEWVDFMESLVDLHYGKPEKYLKSIAALMNIIPTSNESVEE